MAIKEFGVLEKLYGVGRLYDIAMEMHESIVELAGERAVYDTRDSWLARAAKKAGIKLRTARSLFYKEQAEPKFSTVYQVRLARSQIRKKEELGSEPSIMELRTQIKELTARIEAMADRVSL